MFKIIFYCFGMLVKILYKIASKRDIGFKERINSRNMTIVIQTKKGRKAVQYALENGRIIVRGKSGPDPDIAITFSSAARAYLMMLRPTPKLFLKYVTDATAKGDLALEFKAEPMSWLFVTLSRMMAAFRKKSQIKTALRANTEQNDNLKGSTGKADYDVIVIGTGMGGSAAGALAAYYGHKTLILEKNGMIGGRAATYEKQGFKMDHGHVLLRCDKGPHGKVLKMVKCPDLMPKYSYARDWGIKAAVDDQILKVPPNHKRIMMPFILLREGLKFKFSLKELVGFVRSSLNILFITKKRIKKLYSVDAKSYLNRYPINKYINLILCGIMTVCLGAVTKKVSAGSFLRIINASYKDFISIGYPVNGEGVVAIPNSFIKAARRYGAQVELDTSVDKIVVENGAVRGVNVGGKFIEAGKVISSVGIGETVFNLVGEEAFDSEYTERIKNLKYSYGGFSLKYALDKPVTDYPWGGEFPGDLENITEQMTRGILPERLPWMYVAASILDPSLAPEGKQVIYVISGGSPEEPGRVDWQKWMDRVKKQVEEFFPGIKENTIFCDETTPDGIARFSGRKYGDAVGVSLTVDQAGELRPSPVSPIKGLYYAGADVGADNVGTELATESAIALSAYLKTDAKDLKKARTQQLSQSESKGRFF